MHTQDAHIFADNIYMCVGVAMSDGIYHKTFKFVIVSHPKSALAVIENERVEDKRKLNLKSGKRINRTLLYIPDYISLNLYIGSKPVQT